MGVWYHVAEPNSYLVITGAGIEKVMIKKKVRYQLPNVVVERFQHALLFNKYTDIFPRHSSILFKKSPRYQSPPLTSLCHYKP